VTSIEDDQDALVRAARVVALDGPGGVQVERVPVASSPGRTTVEVAYAGVVMPDVLLSQGRYQDQPPLPFTLGCEFAGIVASVGDPRFPPGSRVAGIVAHGAFAERIVVDPGLLLPVPDGVPLDLAAALPANHLTAHYALHARGRIRAGERVLVRGAGGGVGTAAVQLAKAAGAGTIAAVASTPAKRSLALAQGADIAVADPGELAGLEGFDIVVDPVGGTGAVDALRRLRQHGRHLVIGFADGGIPEIAFNRLLLRNIDLVGVYLGYRRQVAPAEIEQMWEELCTLVLQGRASPVIDSVHPLTDVVAALRVIEQRRAQGKVLVRIDV
jgi:NADPH:quinone reductase